jgi:hypothetical protein
MPHWAITLEVLVFLRWTWEVRFAARNGSSNRCGDTYRDYRAQRHAWVLFEWIEAATAKSGLWDVLVT